MNGANSKVETFSWEAAVYDVSGILCSIQKGTLIPQTLSLGKSFIERYCIDVLGLEEDPVSATARRPIVVDISHVDALTMEALACPLLVADVGRQQGLFGIHDEWEANYVIIDGNHRLAFAHRNGVERLRAYVLERQDLLPFTLSIDGYSI
jgi:hypothetical protein